MSKYTWTTCAVCDETSVVYMKGYENPPTCSACMQKERKVDMSKVVANKLKADTICPRDGFGFVSKIKCGDCDHRNSHTMYQETFIEVDCNYGYKEVKGKDSVKDEYKIPDSVTTCTRCGREANPGECLLFDPDNPSTRICGSCLEVPCSSCGTSTVGNLGDSDNGFIYCKECAPKSYIDKKKIDAYFKGAVSHPPMEFHCRNCNGIFHASLLTVNEHAEGLLCNVCNKEVNERHTPPKPLSFDIERMMKDADEMSHKITSAMKTLAMMNFNYEGGTWKSPTEREN